MRLKTLTYGLAACFALVGPVLLLCKDNFPDPLPVKAVYLLLLSLWYVSPFLLVALATHYGKHSITTISALVAALLAGLLVIWHSGELLRLKPSSAFLSMFDVTISQHAIVIPILALSFVFRLGMASDKEKGADRSAPSSDR